ncbi:MAG: ABC transporter substrate-binding protein [Solirubrobacteraceae bacterium]
MIEFRVLGSLEVVEGDRLLPLGSPKQRGLLALLLIHRGEPVSSDRLINELWGEQAPATATKIVQGYVSNLRKVLSDGLLVTRGHAYMLQAEPEQLDVDRFESLVAEGRRALQDGDARIAAERLRGALALWRGPPLADFAYESFAQSEIARLEESRLAALADRIDAESALGEHAQLVAELEGLVREHPLRERFIAQLMLALYRSGRQADALESYREARIALIDGLGLEPSRDLHQLQRAILAQDPGLEPPVRAAIRHTVAHPGHRGGLLVAAAGAVLLAALIAVGLRLGGSGATTVHVAPNSLAVIDVHDNRVIDSVPVGARPGGVAAGFGSLWVTNLDDQTVSRIDPTSLRTLRTIPVGRPPIGVATSAHGVWVVESNLNPYANPATDSVVVDRVDPEFDTVGASLPLANVVSNGPGVVAARGNSVWVAPSTGLLTRLDAVSGAVAQRLDPNASPSGIAIGNGAVWLSDTEADNVVRVDPTGLLTPIPVGNGPAGITVGAGGVWVVDSLDDTLVRIDPGTRSPTATIRVGGSPAGVAFGAGSLWVANSGDGTVTRIDSHTGRVQATIAVGGSPQALTVADGRVWVAVDAQSITPNLGRSGGGTLRMVSTVDVLAMDPALAYDDVSVQLVSATCAQLLNYPDKAGSAGAQLTAEVAQALPTRSADGRTYTFKIRPGFYFWPGPHQPVTAQTFKKTIERTLNPRMQSPLAHYLADVVGASAYMAGKTRHIAGVVAGADTLTIHLLAPAPDFLARLAQPAFCAVPPTTPIDRNGVRAVPSAGPYYVVSDTPGQGVVLRRNPSYHGSRPHRFAQIELRVGISAQRAVAEIEAGAADYTPLGLDSQSSTTIAATAARLAARYGPGSSAAARGRQRYFLNPLLELDAFALNTHRPLFSDVRLRQAVNYAINRTKLAALGSGFDPLPERPSDHYLPPGMPGYRNAHIYPMTPDPGKARHLVQLAQARGRTAVLYTMNVAPFPEQAQIVKTDLAAIGLQVQVKTLPQSQLFAELATPGQPFDLGYIGWQADYPDPSQMLDPLLRDSSNLPPLADRTYQRRLARAAPNTGPKRYLTYGDLDLDVTRRAAPLAAFGNASGQDFFSARIGCQTYRPSGVDLAALCLRPSHR